MMHLKKQNPDAHCLYFGDTLHFPYGTKTSEEVIDCAIETVELILKTCEPSVIVLACNTISITALDALRSRFKVPFIGTVPAIKPAAQISKNRRIGLLATEKTVCSDYTQNLITSFASDCTIISRGDSQLISYIENNLFSATHSERLNACKPAVDFFLSQNVDTIILGCTHFLHCKKEFIELCGNDIHIVDSQDGVVRQALKVDASFSEKEKLIQQKKLLCTLPDQGLFLTAGPEYSYTEKYKKLCSYLNIPFLGLVKA